MAGSTTPGSSHRNQCKLELFNINTGIQSALGVKSQLRGSSMDNADKSLDKSSMDNSEHLD